MLRYQVRTRNIADSSLEFVKDHQICNRSTNSIVPALLYRRENSKTEMVLFVLSLIQYLTGDLTQAITCATVFDDLIGNRNFIINFRSLLRLIFQPLKDSFPNVNMFDFYYSLYLVCCFIVLINAILEVSHDHLMPFFGVNSNPHLSDMIMIKCNY